MNEALLARCSAMCQKAFQAESLLEAAQSLIGDPERQSLGVQLIEEATAICGEINAALDSVNLPKG